jgi:hypothetical protein
MRAASMQATPIATTPTPATPTTAYTRQRDRPRRTNAGPPPGEYVMEIAVSDGERGTSRRVLVTVTGPAGIEIVFPRGGEVLEAGSVARIRWKTVGIDDVTIRFSPDGGRTWTRLAESVDTDSPEWLDFPWRVPEAPSRECLIQVSDYFDQMEVRSGPFEIAAPRA